MRVTGNLMEATLDHREVILGLMKGTSSLREVTRVHKEVTRVTRGHRVVTGSLQDVTGASSRMP